MKHTDTINRIGQDLLRKYPESRRKKFIINDNNGNIYELFESYLTDTPELFEKLYPDFNWDKSLFITGTTGVTKSITSEVMAKLSSCLDLDRQFAYKTVNELEIEVLTKGVGEIIRYTSNSYKAKETVVGGRRNELNDYNKPIAYIFDNVGEERDTINVMGTLFNVFRDIIYRRYELGLPTHIITNLTPEEFANKYGRKILERIRYKCNIFTVTGKSWRIE